MITKELDRVYICSDGKRFLLKEKAEKHEQKLKEKGNPYAIFNR